MASSIRPVDFWQTWLKRRMHVTFIICWCFLLATTFCCGVSTQVLWCKIPYFSYNSLQSNSFPLKVLKVLMFRLNWFLTRIIKLCNKFLVSPSVFIRKIQECLEKSSTIVRKYSWSWTELTSIGPYISICMRSKVFKETIPLIWKGILCCSVMWHISYCLLELELT